MQYCSCPTGFTHDNSFFTNANCALPNGTYLAILIVTSICACLCLPALMFRARGSQHMVRNMFVFASACIVVLWLTALSIYLQDGWFEAASAGESVAAIFAVLWIRSAVLLVTAPVFAARMKGHFSTRPLDIFSVGAYMLFTVPIIVIGVTSRDTTPEIRNAAALTYMFCIGILPSLYLIGFYVFKRRLTLLLRDAATTARRASTSPEVFDKTIKRIGGFSSGVLLFAVPQMMPAIVWTPTYLVLGSVPYYFVQMALSLVLACVGITLATLVLHGGYGKSPASGELSSRALVATPTLPPAAAAADVTMHVVNVVNDYPVAAYLQTLPPSPPTTTTSSLPSSSVPLPSPMPLLQSESNHHEGEGNSIPSSPSGETTQRFELIRIVGSGAIGVVYEAMDHNTNTVVAVKRVAMRRLRTKDMITSLEREVSMLQLLSQVHVIGFIAKVRTKEFFDIVTEFAAGGSLSQVMKHREQPFGVADAASYTNQILIGLTHIHDMGIVHRDIKGDNILIDDRFQQIKIADFGVAVFIKDAELHLASVDQGGVGGTPYWMPPEAIQMNSPISPLSDSWSVGATLVELLTCRPPYGDKNPASALFHIVEDDAVPLIGEVLTSEPTLGFLRQCFVKNVNDRASTKQLLMHEFVTKYSWVKS